jgi:hypothetical protein
MPRKTKHNKYLTSKLQFSSNFILDSVADSNYRGKYDVGGFLIFEWTIESSHHIQNIRQLAMKMHTSLYILLQKLNINCDSLGL